MKITVNEIEKILDNYLEQYLNGEFQTKNVILFGEAGIGRSAVIEKWFKEHDTEINFCYGAEPALLYSQTTDGILVPEIPHRYTLDGHFIKELNKENVVLYFNDFNYSLFNEKDKILENLICNRQFIDLMDGKMSLNNIFLCVMEAFPDNGLHPTLPVIPDNILDCSEIYEVEPYLKEFKD